VHYLTLKHINAMQEPDSETKSDHEKVEPEPEVEPELVETIMAKFNPIVNLKPKPKVKLSIKQH
jgi:hypothetical protein